MDLLGIVVRNERRIRLVFSSALAAGAFSGTGSIVVTSVDGKGVDPNVEARLAVPGIPTNLELALDEDLARGALYQIAITSLPGADSTTVTTTQQVRWTLEPAQINSEFTTSDVDALVYFRDLIVSGGEWVETAQGDLATIEGISNAVTALERRTLSYGIPWDPSYGVKPRTYVDAPVPALRELIGATANQMVSDPRVVQASTSLVMPETEDDGDVYLSSEVQFRGTSTTQQVDVQFPT